MSISTKNVNKDCLKLFAGLFSVARANNSEYDDGETSDMCEGTLAGRQGPMQLQRDLWYAGMTTHKCVMGVGNYSPWDIALKTTLTRTKARHIIANPKAKQSRAIPG